MTLLVICLRGSRARLLPRRATRERCEYARVASGEGKPTRQIPPERVTRYEERSGSVRGLGEHVSRNRESTLHRLTCGPSAELRAARRRAAAALDRQQRPTGRQLILIALVLIYSLVVTSWLAPGLGQLTVPAMIYAGAITAMTASTVFAGFSRPFVCMGQYGIAIGFLQENGGTNSGELGLTTSCRPMLSCSASSRWDDDRAEVPSLPAGDLVG